MTITIIGSGKVGASIALNCAIRDLDDVLLVDIIQGLPQGEAMDMNHQLSEMGIDRLVRGSNNYADISDSGIVILVAGLGRKSGMTRMDLLQTNANIVSQWFFNREVFIKSSDHIEPVWLAAVVAKRP